MVQYNISPAYFWNMDEKGYLIGALPPIFSWIALTAVNRPWDSSSLLRQARDQGGKEHAGYALAVSSEYIFIII
jgi:hypothetical protein